MLDYLRTYRMYAYVQGLVRTWTCEWRGQAQGLVKDSVDSDLVDSLRLGPLLKRHEQNDSNNGWPLIIHPFLFPPKARVSVFNLDSLIWQRDTRGWVVPKHFEFRKRDKDEKTFTFSCNVREFWRTQPSMKESILSLRRLLLQKKIYFSKEEKDSLIFTDDRH